MTDRSLSQWDTFAGSSAANQLDGGSMGVAGQKQTFMIQDNTVYHHGNWTKTHETN